VSDAFPGNSLGRLEFSPKREYQSAGLPTTTLERKKSDVFVVRVTDESVPDAGKKRYALSLSIHGSSARRGGGTQRDRGPGDRHHDGARRRAGGAAECGAPTFSDVLKKTIIYFTYPNPDGWRRGLEGGVFFQR
jgi:hypothetical protein